MARVKHDVPRHGFALELAQSNSTHTEFPADYIQGAFVMWYNAGKPDVKTFWPMLAESNPSMRPSIRLLADWINDEFAFKAMELDEKVERQMDTTLVENKLEMLERQAQIGRKLQEMAWDFLLEKGPETSRNAISMMKLGLDTEREARSVPGFLKGMTEKSDAEVVEELKKLISGDPDILDIEPEEDD